MSQAAPTGSQRLRALGWGEGHTKAFAILQEAAGADLIPALVTDPGDGGCTAETATGTIRATYGPNLLGAMATDPLRRPLIDDWIAVRSWPDGRNTAEAILSRRVTLFQASSSPSATSTASTASPASAASTASATSSGTKAATAEQAQTASQAQPQPPAAAPRRRAAPRRSTPLKSQPAKPDAPSGDLPRRSDSGPDF